MVPWADDPVAIPSPTPPALPAGVPLCTASDVVGRAGQHGVGLGSFHLAVNFYARPGLRCALRYGPQVLGLRADGTTQTVSRGATSGYANPIAVVTSTVGASVDVSAGDSCPAILAGRHDVLSTLRITMPGGGVVDVTVPSGFDDECGGGADYFTTMTPETIPPPSPLTATMDAPPTVRAGDLLRYTVTLANPTDTPVSFDPCPTYTESVATFGGPGKTTFTQLRYRLDCSTVQSIAPRSAVTYAMQLAVPADQLPGSAKFT